MVSTNGTAGSFTFRVDMADMADASTRTRYLIGDEGLAVLGRSRIIIIGLGGVGSFAAEALARAGIGRFVLIDFDDVDITNINRQLHAFPDTVGLSKVELMKERILRINPRADIVALKRFVSRDDVGEILGEPCDYVVDACDTVSTKVALAVCCARLRVPIISSMGAGNRLDPTRFRVADISKTHTCPLARAVRQELRRAGVASGLTVVFSDEKPRRVERLCMSEDGAGVGAEAGEGSGGGEGPGSISFVPPVAGLILAGVVVNDLLRSCGLEGADLRDGRG